MGVSSSWKTSSLSFLFGLMVPLVLPILQFGFVYRLWEEHAVEVKRDYCQNSCWDTVFKAGYETGAGSYKHIYFNATWQTGAMWALTLFAALLLYEASRHLLGVWIAGRLRWRMAILALASIYPHYYGFWTLWGYLNDDFYEQVRHQLLFSLTEAISTVMVLRLADSNLQASPQRLMVIVGVAGGHVLAAAWDQFVGNVMRGEGGLHQVLRDLGFMVPDLLHILLPILELSGYAEVRRIPPAYLISNGLAAAIAATMGGIWLFSICL